MEKTANYWPFKRHWGKCKKSESSKMNESSADVKCNGLWFRNRLFGKFLLSKETSILTIIVQFDLISVLIRMWFFWYPAFGLRNGARASWSSNIFLIVMRQIQWWLPCAHEMIKFPRWLSKTRVIFEDYIVKKQRPSMTTKILIQRSEITMFWMSNAFLRVPLL